MPRFVAAWVPFFDNMDAIIFLAPISAFDEVLAEDPSVNRLVSAIDIPLLPRLTSFAGRFCPLVEVDDLESLTQEGADRLVLEQD